MLDSEVADRGFRAEQALPYLEEVLKTAKDAILDRFMELLPDETYKFTVLKSHLLCLDEIASLVHGDIEEGKRAIDRVQGNDTQKGGIL